MTFGTSDLMITLTPVKPRPGQKPVSRRVYGRYSRPRERMVQEICEAVAKGGMCAYFAVKLPDGEIVVPVPEWKLPSAVGTNGNTGTLSGVANLVQTALDAGNPVEVFGSARTRWTLAVRNERNSAARDALDAEPDSDGDPRFVNGDQPTGRGRIREEF